MISLRRLVVWGAAAICLALSPACAAKHAKHPRHALAVRGPIVNAPAGRMVGVTEGDLHVFKGIPYAEPPIGSRRWKPPMAKPRWKGVKVTTAYGPACMQPQGGLVSVYSENPIPMSEDCLSLNIWTPVHARKAPVLVWIYGGALRGGASREPLYDGAKLAANGIVVVSINYRIGVFGYLAHPELSAESPLGISGNYGLLDQIAALNWVKKNIGAFGGDPANVTIDGQSAGALSVMYLMISPLARGLFAKGIIESGYMVAMPELKEAKYGMPAAEDAGTELAKALNAPDIAAMRAIDAKTLTYSPAALKFAPWGVVDGHVLTGQFPDIFDLGEQARVPIMVGFTQGEIRTLRVLAPPVPASAADYEKTIRERYDGLADDFLKLYPSTDMQQSIWAATRDGLYGWTAERLVRSQTALGEPSYFYMFDHPYPAADTKGLHAFHASELPYVFGTIDRTPPLWPKIDPTPEEVKFSQAMMDYWVSFVRTGKPSAAGEPDWQAYGLTHAYMHFEATPVPSNYLMPGMFTLNEEVMCRRKAAGGLPWNWNVGVASPPLPPQSPQCE